MNKSLSLSIETLTPIWTAGVGGKVDRIHETGLMGSLRWWYEAMVRGVGGNVCNPTSDKSNERCPTIDKEGTSHYCDVCEIFGATGRKRRFRLDLIDKTKSTENFPREIKVVRTYYGEKAQKINPIWHFKDKEKKINPPRNGKFTLRIQSLDSSFNPEIIAGLIQFLANHAALGARNQMGFGVIKIEQPINMRALYDNIIQHKSDNDRNPNLPAIDQMFFAEVKASSNAIKETFNLKYDLRNLFRNDNKLRYFLMGTVAGNRIAAKIKMSHPYGNDNIIRVWGWIPDKLESDEKISHEDVIEKIDDFLVKKVKMLYVQINQKPEEYLHSLLGIEG